MSKYLHDSPASSWCLECNKPLKARGLVRNKKHLYDIGILYSCPCGKGTIWTNSVRNERRLLAFFDRSSDRYTNGFCNDRFDGVPGKMDEVSFLKNGAIRDIIGNENTKVAIDRRSFLEEAEGSRALVDYYRENIDQLRELADPLLKASVALTEALELLFDNEISD